MSNLQFEPQPNQNIPALEQKILSFWKKNRIFEKTLKKTKKGKRFVFYEGPPTANAAPGLHHAYARAIKDLIPRYKTMSGFYVLRKAGWDTHGLPVEIQIEKELGLKTKQEIVRYGIERFNQKCKASVFRYKKEWEEMTERLGFWLDLENPYITYENDYIESVWWALKQIWDKGLIYQSDKVVPFCPRCGTALSDHEVALGYRESADPSLYVLFPSLDRKLFFLVWTTTPWTLPANVALAVGPEIAYVRVKLLSGPHKDKEVILARERLGELKTEHQILEVLMGRDLVSRRYRPLFDFVVPTLQSASRLDVGGVKSSAPSITSGQVFRIVEASFVSLEEGTGIVHIAPAFGAEDLELAKKANLPVIKNVSEDGKFSEQVPPWKGKWVKDADPLIIKDLDSRGLVLQSRTLRHNYPFCWRCETPLLYYARASWYIKTTQVKDRLIAHNKEINWVPTYLQYGRFGNWLENNIDWAISRERFWGTPIPIWVCQNGDEQILIGSRKELKERSGNVPTDLHKPAIDKVQFPCPKCKGKMKRISEVLDVWFDSGAMSFAQWHYPFENQKLFAAQFPADFISEGVDQTRGWFYTLLAISVLLFDKASFKTVMTTGLILDEKGEKMSKSKGNVIEPAAIFSKFGADTLRMYLYLAPLGESIRFSERNLSDLFRKFNDTLWQSLVFWHSYDSAAKQEQKSPTDRVGKLLDQWISSRLNEVMAKASRHLERFESWKAARILVDFTDDLSNWYIRRSRKRTDQWLEYLRSILRDFSVILAPFCPYLAEAVYQQTKGSNGRLSVHLESWPKATEIDHKLNQQMALVRNLASLGLNARNLASLKVRQPLLEAKIKGARLEPVFLEILAFELNILKIMTTQAVPEGKEWVKASGNGLDFFLNIKITAQLAEEGQIRELIRQVQQLRKQAGLKVGERITLSLEGKIPAEFRRKLSERFLKSMAISQLEINKIEGKQDLKAKIRAGDKELWIGLRR